MKYADVLKPILIFSAILICSALIGIPLYISVLKDPRFGHEFSVFLLIMIFWHFTTGLGIILKKRWGMWLFKIYLYVLYLGVPIGTYIASKTLKYIKENKLEEFFN